MKIILSRKGFDARAGGCASPIFEDGSFLSLPIPESEFSNVSLADIRGPHRIGRIVQDLTRGRRRHLQPSTHIHLDPDLRRDLRERKPGWRPLFGQAMAAQRHLELQGVTIEDIFLFFGWFRQVEERDGQFRFKPGSPDVHMLFGWLEVGDIWHLPEDARRIPSWATDHPHVSASWPRNTIYAAAQTDTRCAAGTFRSAAAELILTRKDHSRSRWCLPKWFHPSKRKSTLSYHSNASRWDQDNAHAYLQSVGIGQEFVLDTGDYPEAVDWARGLIAKNAD